MPNTPHPPQGSAHMSQTTLSKVTPGVAVKAIGAFATGDVLALVIDAASAALNDTVSRRRTKAIEEILKEWAILENNDNPGSTEELADKMKARIGDAQFAEHVRILVATVAVARSKDYAGPLVANMLAHAIYEGRETSRDEDVAISAIEYLTDRELKTFYEQMSSPQAAAGLNAGSGSGGRLDEIESNGWWAPAVRSGVLYLRREEANPIVPGLRGAVSSQPLLGRQSTHRIRIRLTDAGKLLMKAMRRLFT